jgi:hypothetical protein
MVRAVLLALLLALLAPGGAAAAARQVPRGWLGVVADGPLNLPDYAQADAEWDRMAGAGAETVRAAVYWSQIQPGSAADLDLSAPDRMVGAAARRGLTVLPVLQGTPAWAAERPGDPASAPRDPEDFARLVSVLVSRYGPSGSLWRDHPELPRLPIRAWQIWNEPNLTRYWNHAPWAPAYVALLKRADAALKTADPGARTVLAGLPNESWKALATLYRAGARGAFDVVALHPYTGEPRNVVRLVEYARREMRRRGDGRVPIWVTELSWPAAQGRTVAQHGGFETTERGQARKLATALPLLVDARRSLGIGRVYWYTWISAEGVTDSAFDYSGLRRVRQGRTVSAPALATFTRLARRLQGCAKQPGDARRCR